MVVTILLLAFLRNIALVLSMLKMQFRNVTQVPQGHEWHSLREDTGRYVENFSPPVICSFTPEQLRMVKVVECRVWRNSCTYSKGTQFAALCWALVTVCQILLGILQQPQGEERERKSTGSVAKWDTTSVASITKTNIEAEVSLLSKRWRSFS